MTITKQLKDKVRKWEYTNIVYGKGYVDKTKGNGKSLSDNMQRRGYEIMRVSPSMSTVNGLKYRKVFGGVFSPNYSIKKSPPYHASLKWHHQGYIKAGKSKGSFLLTSLRDLKQTFTATSIKQQGMLK